MISAFSSWENCGSKELKIIEQESDNQRGGLCFRPERKLTEKRHISIGSRSEKFQLSLVHPLCQEYARGKKNLQIKCGWESRIRKYRGMRPLSEINLGFSSVYGLGVSGRLLEYQHQRSFLFIFITFLLPAGFSITAFLQPEA